jgi:hypothetical protein
VAWLKQGLTIFGAVSLLALAVVGAVSLLADAPWEGDGETDLPKYALPNLKPAAFAANIWAKEHARRGEHPQITGCQVLNGLTGGQPFRYRCDVNFGRRKRHLGLYYVEQLVPTGGVTSQGTKPLPSR